MNGGLGLETILLVILTIIAINLILGKFKIPVILGYIIAGIAVGPYGLKFITDFSQIRHISEFGIVLLMFSIGLEFSFSKIVLLRFPVFILGGLQVILTILSTILIGIYLGMTFVQSFVVGAIIAMSSTALVAKQLHHQVEIHSKHGLIVIGILLFQDLAFVPLIVIISNLGAGLDYPLWQILLLSLLKGMVVIIVIFAVARWLLLPLFTMIERMAAGELFTLTALFVALGSAWISKNLGMTYALGGFISGMMLSETEHQSNIHEKILPFRDLLLGLFFVSIGMLANVTTWVDTWVWILIALSGIILGKAILVILLCQFSGYKRKTSYRVGFILAEGGEFGFTILFTALMFNILPIDYGQVVLAALIISFVFAPILIQCNEKLAKFISKAIQNR